jgi:Mrp family chromosome partitioning ATPase
MERSNGFKALNQMIRDAAWGELDFLLIDLPPGTGDIHLSIIQEVPVTGAVIVSTPQHVALADVRKGIAMFQMESINIPVLGLIENMAYFTPEEFLTINIISLETREHNIWQKILEFRYWEKFL